MDLEINESKRCMASLGGECPYNCAHCYTFIDEYEKEPVKSIEVIVHNLRDKNFNIVYISGQRENFVNPDIGMELCEKLFDAYKTDIMITTRNIFNREQLLRLGNLHKQMSFLGKDLFVCVSIPALNSYKKIESSDLIPSPAARMKFLESLHAIGIYTLLTLRPIFPDSFIPTAEPLEIINSCRNFVDVVISSGLVLHESMLSRLQGFPKKYDAVHEKIMNCLHRDVYVDYVDVTSELQQIENLCDKLGLHFEEHSLPAVKYLKEKTSRLNKIS